MGRKEVRVEELLEVAIHTVAFVAAAEFAFVST